MSKTDLRSVAAKVPHAWQSKILGKAAGANIKVLRMDERAYISEVHLFDEALLVVDGQMNLEIGSELVTVSAGEVYIVPAGVAHSVGEGSRGTLVIVDQDN